MDSIALFSIIITVLFVVLVTLLLVLCCANSCNRLCLKRNKDTDEYGKELGDLVVERNHSPCPTPPPESESHYEAAKFQRPQKNNAAKTNTKKQPPKQGKKTSKCRTRRKKSTEYEEPVYADIGVSDCSSSGSEHDDDDTQSQTYQHPKFKQQQTEPDRPETRQHENPYNRNITRFVFMMEAPTDK